MLSINVGFDYSYFMPQNKFKTCTYTVIRTNLVNMASTVDHTEASFRVAKGYMAFGYAERVADNRYGHYLLVTAGDYEYEITPNLATEVK